MGIENASAQHIHDQGIDLTTHLLEQLQFSPSLMVTLYGRASPRKRSGNSLRANYLLSPNCVFDLIPNGEKSSV